MQENFTQNHALLSIYNELDPCEDFKFKKEVIANSSLGAEYRELKKAVSLLNNQLLEPKSSTVTSILRKSRNQHTELV